MRACVYVLAWGGGGGECVCVCGVCEGGRVGMCVCVCVLLGSLCVHMFKRERGRGRREEGEGGREGGGRGSEGGRERIVKGKRVDQ